MNLKAHTAPKRTQRGQSLVEVAISMSALLVLLAGVMDFGRAYFAYISLRDAAQEGAAYGAIAPSDTAGIRARVREASSGPLDFASFSNDQIDIEIIGAACASPANTVKVTVEYDFMLAAPFVGGNMLPLSAEIIDTILQPPC